MACRVAANAGSLRPNSWRNGATSARLWASFSRKSFTEGWVSTSAARYSSDFSMHSMAFRRSVLYRIAPSL